MFHHCCALQDRFDKFSFSQVVGLAVVAVLHGESTLQTFVRVGLFTMPAEVVPESDVASVLDTFGYADIKVMRQVIGRRAKRFAPGDPEVASMLISQNRKKSDGFRKIGRGAQ